MSTYAWTSAEPPGSSRLPTVGTIAIELHGKACEHALCAAMASYRYTESRSGELLICRFLEPS